MHGRTNDKDVHKHSLFEGLDLHEYTDRETTCHGGSWADYLIVNVSLKAVLDKNPELGANFWATAHLVSEKDVNLSPIKWSNVLTCPSGHSAMTWSCSSLRKCLQ